MENIQGYEPYTVQDLYCDPDTLDEEGESLAQYERQLISSIEQSLHVHY